MEKKIIETLDMASMCGGRRCCPVVQLLNDGSLVTVDGDQRIEYTTEQVVALRRLLISTLPRES